MIRFVLALFVTLVFAFAAGATPLQQRIAAAAPHDTITLDAGIHHGPIVINKPLTIRSNAGAEIRGNGKGKTVHIAADDVTLQGLHITRSGLDLFEDDAAIFVTGNNATIQENVVSDSLHGVYLKKVRNTRIIGNRIHGKTTIAQATDEPVEKGMGESADNCAPDSLSASRRGNGIHQWSSAGTLIRDNQISEARDGIYFSFTDNSHVENNTVHHTRYGLHYMYSNDNVFVNNTFTENAAGAAVMFSRGLTVRNNSFVSNRGLRAYGLVLQSTDDSTIEQNDIEQNAVGLSLNQCNRNRIAANRVGRNYIGLKFASNLDQNEFTENLFVRNLHPVESGGYLGEGTKWAVNGVGNHWDDATTFDLDGDRVNDLPHRELDLLGVLRRKFPQVAFLSDSPALKLLRFAQQRAALPGLNSLEDPKPLTSRFWERRAQRAAKLTTGL